MAVVPVTGWVSCVDGVGLGAVLGNVRAGHEVVTDGAQAGRADQTHALRVRREANGDLRGNASINIRGSDEVFGKPRSRWPKRPSAVELSTLVYHSAHSNSNTPPDIRRVFPADRLPHGWPTVDSGAWSLASSASWSSSSEYNTNTTLRGVDEGGSGLTNEPEVEGGQAGK
eukprot:5086398-Pyramimonas_sp.AAC.2